MEWTVTDHGTTDVEPIFRENELVEWILKIPCQKCSIGPKSAVDHENKSEPEFPCFRCILRHVNNNSANIPMKKVLLGNTYEIPGISVKFFRDIQELIRVIQKNKKLLPEFRAEMVNSLESDPLRFFKRFLDGIVPVELRKRKFSRVIKRLDVFQEFVTKIQFLKNAGNLQKYFELFKISNVSPDSSSVRPKSGDSLGTLYETYSCGKSGAFQVNIYHNDDSNQKLYEIFPSFSQQGQIEYTEIIKQLDSSLAFEFQANANISEKVKIIEDRTRDYLTNYFPNLQKSSIERLGIHYTLNILNLGSIIPYFFDPNIEEVFLDGPRECIYLNHWKFGRCRTRTGLSRNEIDRIMSFLRLESGLRLDARNPSLKWNFDLWDFILRFSIDIEPLVEKGVALDIRRIKKKELNLLELVKLDTLSPAIAAFLIYCGLQRKNITVLGETDSGKTTLINALDRLCPPDFRKIYVEDVIESVDATHNAHQLKFRTQANKSGQTKSTIIENLLHKSPDLIYLGEILTKQDARAMFHCLSTGLKGFQTIHAQSIRSLLRRWRFHFKIDPACFDDLDILVLMKKSKTGRKIMRVSEVVSTGHQNYKIVDFFHYDPQTGNWLVIDDLYQTKLIKQIRKIEPITPVSLEREIEGLQKKIQMPNLTINDFSRAIQERCATQN